MPSLAARGRAAIVGALAVLGALVVAAEARAEMGDIEHSFSGRYSLESRWYPQSPAYPGQRSHATGFVVEPTLFLEDPEGRSFTLTPFFRGDGADSRRTHADVREAYLLLFGELGEGEWEARLGVDRVFWGVAELYNPVDIVNQADLVEHPDGKTKLGQPMAHLTFAGDWGTAELFALPWHRERTFPGRHGRLRSGLVVDPDLVEYESGAEERHLDVAARYSHSFGLLDIGLSVFDGTSREPALRPASFRLVPGPDGMPLPGPDGMPLVVPTALAPYYPQIRQFGLDAQITAESFLLKLEAIHRTGAPNLPSPRYPSRGRGRLCRLRHRRRVHLLLAVRVGPGPQPARRVAPRRPGPADRPTSSRTTSSSPPASRSTTSRAPRSPPPSWPTPTTAAGR